MLLNEDEVKMKTEIWMKENGDYLKAQKGNIYNVHTQVCKMLQH